MKDHLEAWCAVLRRLGGIASAGGGDPSRASPPPRHEEVEFATLGWVGWFNSVRLLEPIDYVPPAEFEQAHDALSATTTREERLKAKSLH